ncbi:MAG TPA: hypothetical protein VMO47_16650 [Rhodothermales bacterium]|nr:hypothetical protein [Rhodothermales bacterium]
MQQEHPHTDRSPLVHLARLTLFVALASLITGCATINHKHTRAAIFIGQAGLSVDTLKGFQEPRFIHLDGEEEITWILKAPPGSEAVLTGLSFMEDPNPGRTDFGDGTVTVRVGLPVTLRLREDATEPVYEYQITIRIGGEEYPVNYPPKVIP